MVFRTANGNSVKQGRMRREGRIFSAEASIDAVEADGVEGGVNQHTSGGGRVGERAMSRSNCGIATEIREIGAQGLDSGGRSVVARGNLEQNIDGRWASLLVLLRGEHRNNSRAKKLRSQ